MSYGATEFQVLRSHLPKCGSSELIWFCFMVVNTRKATPENLRKAQRYLATLWNISCATLDGKIINEP